MGVGDRLGERSPQALSWDIWCTTAIASVNVGGLEVVVIVDVALAAAAVAVAVLAVVVVVVVRASTSIGRRCRGIVAGSEAVVFDQ